MNTQETELKAIPHIAHQGDVRSKRKVASALLTGLLVMFVALTGIKPCASAARSRPGSAPAAAQVAPCAGRITVAYYPLLLAPVPTTFLSQAPWSLATGGVTTFQGYLYLPGHSSISGSPKNLPAIIFSHGSGQPVSEVCAMATYFTDRGFAFFVPHRRGHGLSTGVLWSDYLDQVCNRTAQQPFGTCGRVNNNELLLDYLADQTFEVARAMEFLLWIKNAAGDRVVNPNKVALMGHSFGGMVTLFNNAVMNDHRAAVNIAGASESWDYFDEDDGLNTPDNSQSIRILKSAVRSANKPIFSFQPKNDVSIRPISVLSAVAIDDLQRHQAAIYGPVPPDPGDERIDTETAHGKFVTDAGQIEKWGPAVIEFLARFGVK